MRRFLTGLGTVALAAALMVGFAPAAGASSGVQVVHPGQSIQAAIDAVGNGGTVWVRPGQYQEHLVITHGVNLIGYGATLTPPAGIAPPSPCSAPDPNVDGICIAGDFSFDPSTGAITVNQYVSGVKITGLSVNGFDGFGIGQIGGSGSTFVGVRSTNNGGYGIAAFDSTGTTELFNTANGNHEAGFYIGDSPQANATLIANSASGNGNGFFVRDAEHGSLVGNDAHGNCVGVLFLADSPGPDGSFRVFGNSIRNNSKACPATEDGPAVSGIGVAILGAHDVSLGLNAITRNSARR